MKQLFNFPPFALPEKKELTKYGIFVESSNII